MIETLRSEHRGWHTPSKLPHFDSAQTTQAITFRLVDALPKSVVAAKLGEGTTAHRRRIEAALDAGTGACWLRRPEVSRDRRGSADAGSRRGLRSARLRRHAEPRPRPRHATRRSPSRRGRAGEGVSAKAINKVLGRTGRLRQRDYHDRFMRDEAHFELARAYIEGNPVTAGLAAAAEDWRWSSAFRRSGDAPSP